MGILSDSYKNITENNNDILEEIKVMVSRCATIQSQSSHISRLKGLLKQDGRTDLVDIITNSEYVKNIMFESNVEQENSRMRRAEKPFFVHDRFKYDNVMSRLLFYIKTQPVCDHNILCDIMIALSSRPGETMLLVIDDSGMVHNFTKSRDDAPRPFFGMLTLDESRALLKIRDTYHNYNEKYFYSFVKNSYNMNPSQFRKLGAEYATMNADSEGRRRMQMQRALRHASMDTSKYYDIHHNI